MNAAGDNGQSLSKEEKDEAIWTRAVRESMLPIKNKFLFISSQGGVGKTIVIVNLAMAFAKKGMEVGLMDVNFNSPDIHRMLDIKPVMEMDTNNRLLPREYSDNLKVASIEAVMHDSSETGGWGNPVEISDILQFISNTNWGGIDHLLIDTPPGPSIRLLSVIRAIPNIQIVIVTAPDKISNDNATKMVNFFRREKISIFGWIENMRGFLCQNCGYRDQMLGTGPVTRAVFLNEIPFLGRVPIDSKLKEFGDTSRDLPQNEREYLSREPFDMIVEKIMRSDYIK